MIDNNTVLDYVIIVICLTMFELMKNDGLELYLFDLCCNFEFLNCSVTLLEPH